MATKWPIEAVESPPFGIERSESVCVSEPCTTEGGKKEAKPILQSLPEIATGYFSGTFLTVPS